MRHGFPISPLLFKIVLVLIDRTTRQQEEIKEVQMGKEEVKLFRFAEDTILYLKEPRDETKN
jgi:hypothetical protein